MQIELRIDAKQHDQISTLPIMQMTRSLKQSNNANPTSTQNAPGTCFEAKQHDQSNPLSTCNQHTICMRIEAKQ